MTDRQLSDLLARAADRTEPGPAPTSALLAAGTRSRRRRGAVVTGATVAVVAGIVAATALLPGAPAPREDLPAATQGGHESGTPPAGTRWVGIGQVVVAVPDRWGTNLTQCGVPQRDTVVIDVGAIPACGIGRPGGVDSVSLERLDDGKQPFDFTADRTYVVDGRTVQRQDATCADGAFGGSTVCAASVYLPSEDVAVRAESSTDAATVDRILDRVAVLDDLVAVPGYQTIAVDGQENGGARYLEELERLGLAAEVRTEVVPGSSAGYLRGIEPAAGEVVAPGSTVTVTITGAPRNPGEEVDVGVSYGEGGDDESLRDHQVRSDPTIRVGVGSRVWTYARGNGAGSLAGSLDGDSLEVDDWKAGPNYPHSWVATRPGRTTVTLTVTADGTDHVLGRVTVLVVARR